ncbi:MAG: hypothetical protein WCJ81_05980 [bacterium]
MYPFAIKKQLRITPVFYNPSAFIFFIITMQTGTLFETGITALQNHATTSSIPTVLMAAGVAFVVIMVALILLIIAGMC